MTKVIKLLLSFVAVILVSLAVSAQDKISPLHSNQAIKSYLKEHPKAPLYSARIASPTDTITLPFIDDFSYDGIYPNSALWADSDVYISRDYPDNPPTIGVATFDGLNKYGNPYNSNESIDSIADHLTSRHIKLDSSATDTTIWLSFFYQPGGLSYYPPNSQDSLILEFENPSSIDTGTVSTAGTTVTLVSGGFFITDGSWNGDSILINSIYYQIARVINPTSLITSDSPNTRLSNVNYSVTYTAWDEVWSVPGTGDSDFKQVMINVRDSVYLNSGFRFRFTNIANLGGNADQWLIDYVSLNSGRSASDTGFVDETTFIYRNKPLLAPPFTSMPYSHYKTNPAQYTVTSEASPYKNLTYKVNILNHDFLVLRDDGSIDYDAGITGLNVNPFSIDSTPKPVNYVFPSLPQPSLRYLTLNINTSPHGIQRNDSVVETQVLDNYYSYDDGTAEAAYGIWTANPDVEGDVALRFDLQKQDTLTGVQIFWDQIPEAASSNPHVLPVNLAVWNQITLGTDNANLIYQLVDTFPSNDSTINGFYTYTFDTLLIVQGTIYIGWRQFEQNFLNVGFDFNTDTHDKIYFNVSGIWQQGSVAGSMMIRPIFGSALNTGVHNLSATFNASVFPSPVDKQLTIQSSLFTAGKTTLELFNTLGKRIYIRNQDVTGTPEITVNVANFENGFYILKITDDKTGQFISNKIVIHH